MPLWGQLARWPGVTSQFTLLDPLLSAEEVRASLLRRLIGFTPPGNLGSQKVSGMKAELYNDGEITWRMLSSEDESDPTFDAFVDGVIPDLRQELN